MAAQVAPAHWTEWMVSFMADTLRAHGEGPQLGRAPCSAEERALGEALATTWAGWGFNVTREAFACAPHAFLGVIPLTIIGYLRALRHYHDRPVAALASIALATVLFVLETVTYHEVVDELGIFPLSSGMNVVARLAPRDGLPPAQRLIVSAHQDSAFEFNLFYYAAPYAAHIMLVCVALSTLMLAATASAFLPGAAPAALRRLAYRPLALGAFIIAPCAFWHFGSPVPGAGDDLSGVAVMSAFGGQVAAARAADAGDARFAALAPLLARTEVVLLATSSEEAGLRGAKRFVAAHAAELAALPTAALFLESTHDAAWLSAISDEIFTRAHHNPSLLQIAAEAATAAGAPRPLHLVKLPFGATDGSAFTTAGVASVVLQAVDVRTIPPQYHTRGDTLATVAPSALSVQLSVVLNMAAAIGRGEWDGAPAELRRSGSGGGGEDVSGAPADGAVGEADATMPEAHSEL